MTYFCARISSIVSRVSERVITHCWRLVCSELHTRAQRATNTVPLI